MRPFNEGMAVVQFYDGLWGYIDKQGNDIFPQFRFKNEPCGFRNGLAFIPDYYSTKSMSGCFINKNGQTVIQDIYGFGGYEFSEGLAFVYYFEFDNEFKYDKWKAGYIDKNGKVVIPLGDGGVASGPSGSAFSDGLAHISLDNGEEFYINHNGDRIIQLKGEDRNGFNFREGLAIVSDYNSKNMTSKYGFIDKNGDEFIPVKYDEVRDFCEGLAAVRLHNKWGYVGYSSKFYDDNNINISDSAKLDVKYIDGYFYINNDLQKNTWVNYQGYQYHINEKGNIDKNQWIEGCFVGEDGKMYISRRTPDGKYVGEDGFVVENVSQDLLDSLQVKEAQSDSWYKTELGLWYYFENDRTTIKKGWFTDTRDNQTYYLDPHTGIMAVGWTNIGGSEYYFNESHANEPNWYEVGDGFYESYGKKIKAYGSMFKNETTPDGKKVDEDGKLIK